MLDSPDYAEQIFRDVGNLMRKFDFKTAAVVGENEENPSGNKRRRTSSSSDMASTRDAKENE